MAQDQTLTSSARNPMLEQLIENGIECLDKAENTSEDWLYDLYIADALKEFRRAVEIAPHEPWCGFRSVGSTCKFGFSVDIPSPLPYNGFTPQRWREGLGFKKSHPAISISIIARFPVQFDGRTSDAPIKIVKKW